jgi:ATP-dependent DNA helicase DinG
MGTVITLRERSSNPPHPVLQAYEKLARTGDFIVRPAQVNLSMHVYDSLVSGKPLAAEAPTGTGKTIAYLIGALEAAKALSLHKDKKLVIGTATVALQSQVLTGDIPRLINVGLLQRHEVAIAKGRGRYLCAMLASKLLEEHGEMPQNHLFDTEHNAMAEGVSVIRTAFSAWRNRQWDGDADTFHAKLPEIWSDVAASSDTCIGHKCEYYQQCAFFNARRKMAEAKVIVANHDLVLADLTMHKEGDSFFNCESYLLVVDEAHHLPDKAIISSTASLAPALQAKKLAELNSFMAKVRKHLDVQRVLKKAGVDPESLVTGHVQSSHEAIAEILAELDLADKPHIRVSIESLPADLKSLLSHTLLQHESLIDTFNNAIGALKQEVGDDRTSAQAKLFTHLLQQLVRVNALLRESERALALFTSTQDLVRWVQESRGGRMFCCAPAESGPLLQNLLWSSGRARTVMVSATLRDTEGFSRFLERCGNPAGVSTVALEPIFPFRESVLEVVETKNSPRHEQRQHFEAEVIEALPRFVDEREGTLLLFPSASMMQKALPILQGKFGAKVRAQGQKGIKELVADHRAAIDRGEGSILCGLAALAEGLDLPGRYCTHVAIMALPFAVPTTPVEEALQERLGKAYFMQHALPDMTVKLVQMVGRLMRRESDRGRITLFDIRLMYSRWGYIVRDVLPNFKTRIADIETTPDFSKYPKPVTASEALRKVG